MPALIHLALDEDIGRGDVTTEATVSSMATATAEIRQKEAGVLCGLPLVDLVFSTLDPGIIKAFHLHKQQRDVWFVPPEDRVLLVLVDVRDDSPTAKRAPVASLPRAMSDGSATTAPAATSPAASERKAGPVDVRSGRSGGVVRGGGQGRVSGGSCLTSSTT